MLTHYELYCFTPGDRGCVFPVDGFRTMAEAVAFGREHWNEDRGPQTFIVADPLGNCHAVMSRPDLGDPDLCRTLYSDGRAELHRCRYVTDRHGWYDHTEITPVEPQALSCEHCPGEGGGCVVCRG